MHRRALIYAALALAVPLPALALSGNGGGESPPPQVDLAVAASLDGCGTAADTIVCKIDASWNAIPGATRYTANVTRADGSVVDFGDVGAGSGSFWVPYAGNGTYTVSISAYGTPPGAHEPELVARDRDLAGSRSRRSRSGTPDAQAPAPDAPESDSGTGLDTGEEAPRTDVPAPPPEPEEPSCEKPADPRDREEPARPDPVEPAPEETRDEERPLDADAATALDETAELPESVDCPEPEPEPEPVTP